jgi:hypothetical protein
MNRESWLKSIIHKSNTIFCVAGASMTYILPVHKALQHITHLCHELVTLTIGNIQTTCKDDPAISTFYVFSFCQQSDRTEVWSVRSWGYLQSIRSSTSDLQNICHANGRQWQQMKS